MKRVLFIIAAALIALTGWAGSIKEINEDFKVPEAVCFDESDKTIFVSNINGGPGEKDNNGFISKLNTKGKVIDLHFIEGGQNGVTLNAPKGMILTEGKLIVTDIDHVRGFEAKTGAPLFSYAIEGAAFLNDICLGPEGEAYITDTGTGKIHKLDSKQETVTLFADGAVAGFSSPNGILYYEKSKNLVLVGWGQNTLWQITLEGEVANSIDLGAKNLDGIVADNKGNLYVSSWESKAVHKVDAEGNVAILKDELPAPADIAIDSKGKTVIVPLFQDNKLVILRVK